VDGSRCYSPRFDAEIERDDRSRSTTLWCKSFDCEAGSAATREATMPLVLPVAILTALLLSANELGAQECENKSRTSADQQARRDASVRYLAAVKAAHVNSHQTQGR